jgi:hypothetical protein
MIRSYNHKGFVLEIAVETTFSLVANRAGEPPRYLVAVTISRSGRPVTSFSALPIARSNAIRFASAEDAIMCAHSVAQSYVDEWTKATP